MESQILHISELQGSHQLIVSDFPCQRRDSQHESNLHPTSHSQVPFDFLARSAVPSMAYQGEYLWPAGYPCPCLTSLWGLSSISSQVGRWAKCPKEIRGWWRLGKNENIREQEGREHKLNSSKGSWSSPSCLLNSALSCFAPQLATSLLKTPTTMVSSPETWLRVLGVEHLPARV